MSDPTNGNLTEEHDLSEPDSAEAGSSANEKKPKGLKKLFGYKISIEQKGEAEPKKKTAAKAKPKKKKPASKPAKKKTATENKSKKPILIAGILLVVVVAVILIVVLTGSGSPEKKLEKAYRHMADENYTEAIELFDSLLEEETVAADAYLGVAQAYIALEDTDSAIIKLEAGYTQTTDGRISEKLAELRPEDDPESEQEPANRVVSWSDPAFERMVRQALDMPSGDIRADDLSHVRSLKILGETHVVINETLAATSYGDRYVVDEVEYTERGGIRSLADAANFPNLTTLSVGYNSVSDISGIEACTRLELLGIYANEITDLSPISELTGLKYLYAYHNNIQSLEPLSELTGLRHLWVQHNRITDLSPVSGLGNLSELFSGNNEISSLPSMSGLSSLHFLYLEYNSISDISALSEIDTLTDVSFTGNPISDLSPVSHVNNVNRPFGRIPT